MAIFMEGAVKIDILDGRDYCRRTAKRPFWAAARVRRTSVFTAGENLGAGGIHFRRAFQIPTVTIKITTPGRCGYFYGRDG